MATPKNIPIISARIAGLAAGVYAQLTRYRSHIFDPYDLPGGLFWVICVSTLLSFGCTRFDELAFQTSKPTTNKNSPVLQESTGDWWRPAVGTTWQWQLGDEEIDTSLSRDIYDIDMDVDQAQIDALHALGAKVICYISVGSWEAWRADANRFPQEVLGKDYEGWTGEKWLDIRRIDLLAPILRARFDLCKAKGFDAIEPDNMDIYTNDTGFPLTAEDQLQFARWLAQEAHSRNLAIGVKNAPDQVNALVNEFDFAITEDCFAQDWCAQMLPFITAGKPVFAAEYTDTRVDFEAACAWGKAKQISFILKNRELDAWIEHCP